MRSYVIAIGAALLVFAAGVLYQRASQPDLSAEIRSLKTTVANQERARPAAAPPTFITSRSGIDREELREEIKNALLAARAADAAAANDTEAEATVDSEAEPEAVEPPSEQTVTLRNHASSVVDSAISRGNWSTADRDEFRKFANQITDSHIQFELFRRLGAAINDGTLKWESLGPAF